MNMNRAITLLAFIAVATGVRAWTFDAGTRIVVPAEAGDPAVLKALHAAAAEFAGAVEERTRLRPEVVRYDAPVEGKAVYVGGLFARSAGLDTDSLRGWENAVAEKGGSVYLYGGRDFAGRRDARTDWAHCVLPSLRAMTRFMEKFMEARFVMPGRVGLEVRPGAVIVPDGLRDAETPRLDYGAGHNRDALGSIANQCFGAGDYLTYGGHLYPVACPMEKYAKTHPEYFGVVKGRRYCELSWAKNGRAPLCFTNPEVEDLIVAEMLRQYDAGARVCQLAPADSALYCECDRCQDYGGLRGNSGTNHSEQIWLFHRHIAERIEKLRPGKVVHILSYGPTHRPPRDFKTFPSNVMVEVCEATDETLRLWSDFKVPHGLTVYIYLWGDYQLVGITPRHSFQELAESARTYLKYGVHGIYRCGYGELWGLEGPGYYVFNRMLRDPQADVDATVDEFCRYAFGPAEGPMRRFYAVLDRQLAEKRPNDRGAMDMSGRTEGFMAAFDKEANLAALARTWTPDALSAMGRELAAAEGAAGVTDRQRRRLKLVRAEFTYLERLMAVVDAYGRYKAAPNGANMMRVLDGLDARNAFLDSVCDPKTGRARIDYDWPELVPFGYMKRELLQRNGRSAGLIEEPLAWDTARYRDAYDVARWRKAYESNPNLVRLTDWRRSPGHESATVEVTRGGRGIHLVPAAANHDVRAHCPFAAKPKTRYRLSWFLKLRDARSLNPRGGAPGLAVVRNGDRRDERIEVAIPPMNVSTTDWMRQSVEFETLDRPKIDGEISFRLYRASGEAWFADVVLEEAPF